MPGIESMIKVCFEGNKERYKHKIYINHLTTADNMECTIDTCMTTDCGWETGIEVDGLWVIPQRYPDESSAQEGHEKWKKRIQLEAGLFEKLKQEDVGRYLNDENYED